MHEPVRAERLFEHIGQLLTLEPGLGEGPLGIIRDGAIAVADGKIAWIGRTDDVAGQVELEPDADRQDLAGRVVMPGLVDCHTHLVFAGGRESEFDLRVAGATYQEIAASGGGIASTVRATREASFDDLLDLGLYRLSAMLGYGVTTCEIKSGYGLSLAEELKILRVIQSLSFSQPVSVVPTFLGAHTVPVEHRANREAYLRVLIDEMIPQVAEEGLAEFCDVFCEEGAFSLAESRRVLSAAQDAGLKLKVHAEQLTAFGGARLAAELGAVSADHLEHADDASLAAMREAGTVAVLLPGAAFFLGQPFPDARRMRDAGVSIAIATDFNPGSSPTFNLPLVGTMAAVRMGLSAAEVLRGMTVEAAKAVGREHEVGRLAPGMTADLAVFEVRDYRTILYQFGTNLCAMVVKDGEVVYP